MVRLNGGLDRRAAHKASYRESGEEDDLRSPEPAETVSRHKRKARTATTAFDDQEDDEEDSLGPSQKPSRKKRQAAQNALKQAVASSDNESSAEENDPSHATGENSRVRIDQVIQDLMKAGKDTLTYCDTTPLKSEPRVEPPALDLGLIKLSTDALLFLDDSVLYGYLTSNDFLPCIAQWKKECIDNSQLKSSLLAALPNDEYPFVETATYLAQTAPKYVNIIEGQRTLNHPHAEIMLICVKYVWRLERCTMAHFMHFLREAEYPGFQEFIYLFCARAMLTVYADLRLHGMDGFFAIMLDSRFAEPMTMEARKAWDKLLILPGGSSGANTAASVGTIQAASLAYAKSTGFKSHATPLNEDETRELHFKVEAECWKLRTAFIDAVGDSPELKIIVPSDVGQTEASKRRKQEKKAGRPPQFKRKMISFCDSNCTPKTNTHSRECTDRLREAQEKWQDAKGRDVEADVPDQNPAGVDFTFQQKQSTLIPPEQVISRFNQRDVVEPFSDEEKLVALRRFGMVLDLAKGDLVDGAFEWTMISEVLAGRGVADCIRFYYQHKHIIFMKLQKRPDPDQGFVPSGVPEWGAEVSLEQRRQLEGIIDVNRFEQYMATLQERNTDLRIRDEMLEADACSALIDRISGKRGDRHLQSCIQKDKEVERLKDQLKAFQLQKNRENEDPKKESMAEIESLKKQLAESKAYAEKQERLVADGKKLSDW